MKNLIFFALACCLIIGAVLSSTQLYDDLPGCTGTPNTQPIYDEPPVFVSQTTNGKRYYVGKGDDKVHIIHVYGTDYEMGKAQGELMKEEINQMIPEYLSYIEDQIAEYLSRIPKKWAEYIARFGFNAALDLNWEITRRHTPQRYVDEMKGLEAGSGMDWKAIRRLNLIPELTKAGCSIFGAWGEATKYSLNGTLVQLRALDWDANAPIKKYATVTVYHPSEKNSTVFANIGYPAFIGSITGYSAARVGISEKVWLANSDIESRFGMPWTYVLRDVLQYDKTVESAITRMANAPRTCAIHVGVGDSTSNEFRGIEYAAKAFNIYNWDNQPEYDGHPKMKDLVYWDKSKQPSHHTCFSSLLKKYYGKIDSISTIRDIAAIEKTGNMQVAVMDYHNNIVYVANAARKGAEGGNDAYGRSYVKLDFNQIFSEEL